MDNYNIEKFYKEFPQFEIIQRKNFERRISVLQKRILNLLALTAAEKYSQFIEDYSEFEKIILKHNHLKTPTFFVEVGF
jgi:hypothetical protein